MLLNAVIVRDYDDFTLVYNLKTNRYAKVNSVAGDIIEYIRQNHLVSVDDIVAHIKEQYMIEDDITNDIVAFCDDLSSQQILTDTERKCLPVQSYNSDENNYDIESEIIEYMSSKRKLFSATFEMTYQCNEHCIHCYAYSLKCFNIVFTGGDPFIRKDFIELFEYSRDKNFSVDIYTNGLVLSENEDIFNRIVTGQPKSIYISLYSSDPDLHDKITSIRGSWNRTVDAIKKLRKANTSVTLNILVMKDTFHTLHKTIDFAKSLDVAYRIGWNITETNTGSSEPMKYRLDDEKQVMELFRTDGITSRYNFVQKPLPDDYICGAGVTSVTITPCGDIKPCVSLNKVFGNVIHDTIKDVFYGENMTQFVCGAIWSNTEKCKDCDYMSFCQHCIANSYNETGNIFSANNEDCFFAKCLYEAYQ